MDNVTTSMPAHSNRKTVLRMLTLSSALVVAVAVAACAPASAPAPTAAPSKPAAEAKAASPAAESKAAAPAAQPAGPLAEIKVAGLFLTTCLCMLPYQVAEKRGIFRDMGLNVQATNFNEPPATINAVGRDFDWGDVSPQVVLNAFTGGRSDLRIIAALLNTTTVAYAVPKESPIQKPADLKGKKIAVAVANGTCHNFAIDMLRGAGLDPQKDVEMVTGMPGSWPGLWTATKTGQFAATCLIPPVSTQMEVTEGARIIFNSADHVKGWTESVLVTTTDVIQKKREAMTRQIAALRAADDQIANSPEEIGRIWADVASLDPQIAVETLKRMPKTAWSVQLKADAFQAIEQQMQSTGQLKAPVDWNTLIDRSLLPPDMQSS